MRPVIAVVVTDCRVPWVAEAVTRILFAVLTLVITPVSRSCAAASVIMEARASGTKTGNRRVILVKCVCGVIPLIHSRTYSALLSCLIIAHVFDDVRGLSKISGG